MVKICRSADIPEGSLKKFTVGRIDIAVGRRNSTLFACSNWCPHRGASMHKGYYKDNNIVCYMHDYEFDVCTGRLTNMKSWKKSKTWVEQDPAWRASGDLVMYDVLDDGSWIHVLVPSSEKQS